jgi:hypothetical protein
MNLGRRPAITVLELVCIVGWLVLIAIDATMIFVGQLVTWNPAHSIALCAVSVISIYALTIRALRPVLREIEGLRAAQAAHAGVIKEVSGEIPRVATGRDLARLALAVEASDRDRDLELAGMHDALKQARADAAKELQASMRWVIERFRDLGVNP